MVIPAEASTSTDNNDVHVPDSVPVQVQKDTPCPDTTGTGGDSNDKAHNVVKHTNDTQDNKFYEIEKIICKKFSQDKWIYRVKWRSFASKHNSWVSLEDLNPACQKLVQNAPEAIPTYGKKTKKRKN